MGLSRYFIAILFAVFCLTALLVPPSAQLAGGPILLTQTNSNRAIAVDSVTLVTEPFAPTSPLPVNSDNRTRVVLFANNLSLAAGETIADVTASAEDANHIHYPLAVEYIGNLSGATGVTSVIDRDNWKLYELYRAFPINNGASWNGDSGAVFDLNSNALRPAGWTSADAAGLPIFPGLVRYDEVFEQKEIRHAIRFTAQVTRRAYVHPARHWASTNTSVDRPPMGMRVRLKASVNISGYPPSMQVILRALKKHGMILADNGSNWFISGAPDPRWNDDELNSLKSIKGSDFEVVRMVDIITP